MFSSSSQIKLSESAFQRMPSEFSTSFDLLETSSFVVNIDTVSPNIHLETVQSDPQMLHASCRIIQGHKRNDSTCSLNSTIFHFDEEETNDDMVSSLNGNFFDLKDRNETALIQQDLYNQHDTMKDDLFDECYVFDTLTKDTATSYQSIESASKDTQYQNIQEESLFDYQSNSSQPLGFSCHSYGDSITHTPTLNNHFNIITNSDNAFHNLCNSYASSHLNQPIDTLCTSDTSGHLNASSHLNLDPALFDDQNVSLEYSAIDLLSAVTQDDSQTLLSSSLSMADVLDVLIKSDKAKQWRRASLPSLSFQNYTATLFGSLKSMRTLDEVEDDTEFQPCNLNHRMNNNNQQLTQINMKNTDDYLASLISIDQKKEQLTFANTHHSNSFSSNNHSSTAAAMYDLLSIHHTKSLGGLLGMNPCARTQRRHSFTPTSSSSSSTNKINCQNYVCSFTNCFKQFSSLTALKSHVKLHSLTKDFSCEECNLSFRRLPDLYRHQRSVHSAFNPHVCFLCNKKFPRADSLKRHQSGKRKNPCNF